MAVDNFSWVIPGKLAGCALPGGAFDVAPEYVASDLRDLRGSGVRCLVSVQRMPGTFGELCAEQGLAWEHFPIEDFGTPSDREGFEKLVERIVKRLESDTPVCVHCRAGIGRTGVVLACVVGRMFGIDGYRAVETVRKSRPALDTGEQTHFVHLFCETDG